MCLLTLFAKNSEFTVCDLLLNLWLEAISINSLYFVEIKEKTSNVINRQMDRFIALNPTENLYEHSELYKSLSSIFHRWGPMVISETNIVFRNSRDGGPTLSRGGSNFFCRWSNCLFR